MLEELNTALIEYSIATEEEINLVVCINGYNEETLLSILYARTGLNSLEQLLEEY